MKVFRKEFDRRLWKLYRRLEDYFETGKAGGILPAIFSCASYVWCKNPNKNVPNSFKK